MNRIDRLTAHLSEAQRKLIITRATLISAGIIAFFALVGRFLLDRLGINLYAFDIAGGALLFLIAVDMLFGRQSGTRETKAESEEAMTREDIVLTHSRHSAGSSRYSIYLERS